jgi:hypothetical protein
MSRGFFVLPIFFSYQENILRLNAGYQEKPVYNLGQISDKNYSFEEWRIISCFLEDTPPARVPLLWAMAHAQRIEDFVS